MELPADPSKILYGIYNRHGIDITKPRSPEQQFMVHALSDPWDTYNDDDSESLFGIMDYSSL